MSEYLHFDHEARKFKILFSDQAYSKEELLNFVKQLEEKENENKTGMSNTLFGQCSKCGGNLTNGHLCGQDLANALRFTSEQEEVIKRCYNKVIYETAFVELMGGRYTRADIKEIVKYFDRLDKENQKAVEDGASLISVPHPDGNELNPDYIEEIEIEIEKPEGFELRDRRSDKSKKAADWTPSDALYDAAQAIKKHHACTEMIIIWWETLPDGKQKFHWRNATSSAAQVSHLLVNMLLHKGHF